MQYVFFKKGMHGVRGVWGKAPEVGGDLEIIYKLEKIGEAGCNTCSPIFCWGIPRPSPFHGCRAYAKIA